MRMLIAAVASVLAVGCDAPPAPDAKAQQTAPELSSTASSNPSAKPAAPTATALRAAGAKSFQDTADADFGTLPDGVGIAVGQAAPDFALPAVEGGQVKLSELLQKSEVLLVFYRGGW